MIQARLQISGQINGRENLTGGLNTSIKEIKPELENLTVTPLTEEQKFKSEKYGYDEVIVERVTADIDPNIKSENIKVGETILGVPGGYKGIDTSDADAVEKDIAEGKTAYVNGKKIIGDVTTVSGSKPFTPNTVVDFGGSIGFQNIFTKPYLFRNGSKILITENYDKIAEEIGLTPEQIVEGNTVLNIKGSGKTGIDTSDATVEPSQMLVGQTAYAKGQKIEGTMPNNGALSFEPSDEEQNIPTGYVEGAKVKATDITKLNEYDACLTLANSIETTEDYTDTTATAEDIKEGKVAYSNGERIVGTGKLNDLVITDASYLFYHGVRIKQFSKILPLCGELTNMEYMFSGGEFGSINFDAYKLNTSNVTLMRHMFSGCNSVKSINITSFDTSKVTDMSYMFGSCFLLNDIDFSNFDTSNVTNIGYMFTNNYSLVDLDLSSFDLSKVNYGITNMFYACSGLTNLKSFKNLGKGYGNKGYNYNSYSLSLESCKKITYESLMDVITNGLYDLNLTYDVANGGLLYTQKLILGTTNLAKLTAEEIAIATAKGWTVS